MEYDNNSEVLTTYELESIRRGLKDIVEGRIHQLGEAETLDTLLDRI